MKKKSGDKNTFLLYKDWKPLIDACTSEQAGDILKGIYAYVCEGEAPEFNNPLLSGSGRRSTRTTAPGRKSGRRQRRLYRPAGKRSRPRPRKIHRKNRKRPESPPTRSRKSRPKIRILSPHRNRKRARSQSRSRPHCRPRYQPGPFLTRVSWPTRSAIS